MRRCLTKDRKRRLRSAGDAAIEIQDVDASPLEESRPESAPPPPMRWPRQLAAAALLLLAGVAIGRILGGGERAPATTKRFDIALPRGSTLAQLDGRVLALSPDGTHLVYIARSSNGAAQLYLRRMDSRDTQPMPGTQGAYNPFFSPDGEWVGFSAAGGLRRVAVRGGAPVTICDCVIDSGASWGPDDTIVFAVSRQSGLMRVAAFGGEPEVLTRPQGSSGHLYPQFLPDGESILVQSGGEVALATRDGELATLLPNAFRPRYVPSGHLVYEYEGSIFAVAYDPKRNEVKGTPVPVLDGVRSGQFDVANDGTLLYLPGGAASTEDRSLVWVDRQGSARPLLEARRAFASPRLSPDGKKLLVGVWQGPRSGDVWLIELSEQRLERLTFGGGSFAAIWSPDGASFVYAFGSSDGSWELRRRAMDNSSDSERLFASQTMIVAEAYSPDGSGLMVSRHEVDKGYDVLWLSLDGPRELVPYYSSPAYDSEASFSPDGKWVAYASEESGEIQVYAQAFPVSSWRSQVSSSTGSEPVWIADGDEIVYRDGRTIMSVSVRTEPSFELASEPIALFEAPFELKTSGFRNYDVSADGESFVMVQSEGSMLPDRMVVVLNWFDELKRLVPTDH